MKTSVLTQKNVCAFLGLIMALMIVFSANANGAPAFQIKESVKAVQEEIVAPIEIDMAEIQAVPAITFINKYGEVVAQFFGDKTSIEKRFGESLKKSQFITSSGNQEFYLVN